MFDFLTRTESMLGSGALEILKNSHVLVLGLGGVGGHAAETLCRGGIGKMTLVDSEVYELSNCNRQLFATRDTLGKKKTEEAKKRLFSINPLCSIRTFSLFISAESCPEELFEGVDYILDAIDTVSAKLLLIKEAKKRNIPILSCMGTGNKLDPSAFRIADIYKTKVCPLARAVRGECRKNGIDSLKVLYSEEAPFISYAERSGNRSVPASVSFVPGVAGMIMAGEIIKDLIGKCL